MSVFTEFHRQNLAKWIRARHPDFDYKTIDFESMWDSSISVSENFSAIESKLEEYGLGKTKWIKQEYKEWGQRASEWYQNEIRQQENEPQYEIEYFSLEGFQCYGFEDDGIEYAIFVKR